MSHTEDFEITVNGKLIKFNPQEVLAIKDISTEMDEVAARIAYWGFIWGQAEEEAVRADAYYRNWRNKEGEARRAKDEKLSEWKVWNEVEAMPKFTLLKQAIAESARNVTTAKGIYEAFKIKASILQSKGALQRAEMENLNMSTPETPRTRSRVQEDRDGVDPVDDAEPAVSGTRQAPTLPASTRRKVAVAQGEAVLREAVTNRTKAQGG